jgi:beta-1,4-mannosyltransferase
MADPKRKAPPLQILACPAFSTRYTNPYNCLLYSNMDAEVCEYSPRLALTRNFDILNLHWPEQRLLKESPVKSLLSCLFLFLTIDLLRFRGCRVIWTVHNLSPHDCRYPSLERWYYRRLLSRIDGYLSLGQTATTSLRKKFAVPEQIPIQAIPHGHYQDVYPTSSMSSSRNILGIPRHVKVILFFGQIRPYKNLGALIKAFHGCAGNELCLLIAGNSSGQMTQDLMDQISDDSRITLYSRHIRDDEVQLFFGACDLVVLPYKEILNSGSAILALSFNRPVLVPNIGAMRDLSDSLQPGWVRTYEGDLSAAHLHDALKAAETQHNTTCDLHHLNWKTIAQQTLDFFHTVTARDHRTT